MNEIMTFVNEEFGSVRSTVINGEPWLVGRDIAIMLGYTEAAKAVRTHVDEEDKGVSILVLLTNPLKSSKKAARSCSELKNIEYSV